MGNHGNFPIAKAVYTLLCLQVIFDNSFNLSSPEAQVCQCACDDSRLKSDKHHPVADFIRDVRHDSELAKNE
jgi:hypothetical protein